MSETKDPQLLKEMNDLLFEYEVGQKLPVKNTLDQMNKQSYIDDVVKRMEEVLARLGKAALALILILMMTAACFASNVPGKKESWTIGYAYENNSVVTADRYNGLLLKQSGLYVAGDTPLTENISLVSYGFIGESTAQIAGPYSTMDYSGKAGKGMIGLKIEW